MLTWQIRKICPQCIILDSDYELYGLFASKMFSIVRSFTPQVEEYSIDEGFADIKGLRRPLHMTYYEIAKEIKEKMFEFNPDRTILIEALYKVGILT